MSITLDLKPEIEAGLKAQAGGSDQWEKGLDEWLDSFPQRPVLSDDALKRENWYPDRW